MDERCLAGKTALVTGAGRGIGAAIAEQLSGDGAHVILVARSESVIRERALALTDRGLLATAIAADIGDEEAIRALMDSAARVSGTLDIVVNNAGVLPKARRTEKVTRDEWDSVMAVNLTAPWSISCRAKELMAATGGGVIVNVASTAAFFPSAGLAAYNVGKAALVMLTRVCALEWASEGIRVVGVAPGKVDTDMVTPILDWTSNQGLQVNPLNRVAGPDEIADLVTYLVSPAARYVTGVTIPIDGGELLTYGR
ncbi:MAG: SDR family NAD(P)-dependent oxidoreductase [Mycobacterium sp.]|uniref:SDR family NAD(P)-dependent oxidoreductase n=2 Tax=Mycobacterium sp. TaxID=1785 RepID=UPI003C86C9CC